MPEWKSGRIRMGDEWKSGCVKKWAEWKFTIWTLFHNLDHLVELLVSTALKDLFYIWTIYSTFGKHFQTHRFLVKHWRKYDKRQSTKVSQRWKWFHWSHISSKIPAAGHYQGDVTKLGKRTPPRTGSSCLLPPITPHTFSLSLSSGLTTGTCLSSRRPPRNQIIKYDHLLNNL